MNTRNHMLGNEKMSKLLFKLSLPATIGMIVNALYNLIDTIFVGRGVSPLAIGGLTIALPIQMIIMAFAQMIGIGTASLISRSLGAKDIEKADMASGNAFLAITILSTLTMIFGLIFIDPLLKFFGATEKLLPYSKAYLSVIFLGSIFYSFAVASNNIVRAEGNAKVAMFTMIVGTGLNIILDPIFIFVLKLGIKGAALATIISQFVSFLYILKYLYSGKSSIKVKLHHLKPNKEILKEIFSIGSSAFARQTAGSILAIIINNSLKTYGSDAAITIYGIINRFIIFLCMPIFGTVQGMQPIAGFNYGAKKIDRVKEVVKLSIITTTVLASFGALIAQIFPISIMKLFGLKDNLAIEGSKALRIVISMLPIIGIQIVGATFFQSIGKAVPSLILSLSRQLLFFIPIVLILPHFIGLYGIWLAFPISDILSTIITTSLVKREMKKISLKTI
ncbi:putative efflux protein, MATE family [Caminicella sporogenes DSM 14501]|uniref:Multidrug export protein MepA n=1 Tax=Caminicella sporogenes DSM 14501 TaxID=1121266 RepID=A0A1M6QX65_9FIRM|nr:MATE family efflux transporter [Caminicella sporogenes]RKD20875.1 MATE family efflux transporter [Caminicella sporogenes]SHK24776.1 putative efflux protein, MATE family [Caminicella sporogenes DSM 14501]